MSGAAHICSTCGNQHSPTPGPPAACAICEDERQYVGWGGQEWTTLAELGATGHRTELREIEPGLWGVGVAPVFGIGQRGLVVLTPDGNVLWDPPGYVDDAAFETVAGLGGINVISASHPHFYGVMVEWAHAFEATILLPAADREWVMRPDRSIDFFGEATAPLPGVRLIRCGGHFEGSAVLEWANGAAGAGALLTGDTITVVQDRDWISVMRSYPNLIPVDEATIRSIAAIIEELDFDRVYGGWWDRIVASGAKQKVMASIERYIDHARG